MVVSSVSMVGGPAVPNRFNTDHLDSDQPPGLVNEDRLIRGGDCFTYESFPVVLKYFGHFLRVGQFFDAHAEECVGAVTGDLTCHIIGIHKPSFAGCDEDSDVGVLGQRFEGFVL